MNRWRAGVAIGVLACASCKDNTAVCAGVGLARNEPADTTIAVGASFVARYYQGGMCVGDESSRHLELVPVNTWFTEDTTIVLVDEVTGRVTGRAIGDTRLRSLQHGFAVPVRVR